MLRNADEFARLSPLPFAGTPLLEQTFLMLSRLLATLQVFLAPCCSALCFLTLRFGLDSNLLWIEDR